LDGHLDTIEKIKPYSQSMLMPAEDFRLGGPSAQDINRREHRLPGNVGENNEQTQELQKLEDQMKSIMDSFKEQAVDLRPLDAFDHG